jgi:hypothetical protein
VVDKVLRCGVAVMCAGGKEPVSRADAFAALLR